MVYITSITDTDLYKFTMQNAILQKYPKAVVKYKFNNRNKNMKFNEAAYNAIVENINNMASLRLTEDEESFLAFNCPYLPLTYLNYLRNYRFKPEQVTVKLIDGDLDIEIYGPWHETVLWEVPLMGIISEAYFRHVDLEWRKFGWKSDQIDKLKQKASILGGISDKFTDFGTRRRRSYEVQDLVVKTFKELELSNFFGTSNVHFAHKYKLNVVGTFAHEFVMGISALESLRYANRMALQRWQEVYNGALGYALTDTFGTANFFDRRNFDLKMAKLYDGLRHDSGCPFVFADKAIKRYQLLGVDPRKKSIIFSDALDPQKAVDISNYCKDKIGCSFGIGTNFTNDFDTKALNMVIKLHSVDDIAVVKLSDTPSKAIGDPDALRVALWTFFNTPLDSK